MFIKNRIALKIQHLKVFSYSKNVIKFSFITQCVLSLYKYKCTAKHSISDYCISLSQKDVIALVFCFSSPTLPINIFFSLTYDSNKKLPPLLSLLHFIILIVSTFGLTHYLILSCKFNSVCHL
mgnify:CR=1 FL=1